MEASLAGGVAARHCLTLLLALLVAAALAGETDAAEVEAALYLKGDADSQSDGDLDPLTPGSEIYSRAPVNNTPGASYIEVAEWASPVLEFEANASGTWTGEVVAHSSADINIQLQFSLLVNGEIVDQFETSNEQVSMNGDVELSGSGSLPAQTFPTSGFKLRIESRWSYSGQPPPLSPEANPELRYGSTSEDNYDGHLVLLVDHVRATLDGNPVHDSAARQVAVHTLVEDAFGAEWLPEEKQAYTLRMGPAGASQWDATTDRITDEDSRLVVKFVWSYDGQEVPPGDNDYNLHLSFSDMLSEVGWDFSFSTSLYVAPVPDIELSGSTTGTVAPGGSRVYSVTATNTGNGDDTFRFSTELTVPGWDAALDTSALSLEAGQSQTVKLTITAPDDAGNGDPDGTRLTAVADSDSGIHDSLEFSTSVVVPPADWSFSLVAEPNDDWDGTYYLIRDRAPVTVTLTLTNQGNQNNDFSLQTLVSPVGAFSATVQPSYVSSVAPGGSEQMVVQIAVMEDFLGSTGVVTIEASGSGNEVERADLDLRLEQSGSLNLGTSNLQLLAEQSGSAHHTLIVANSGPPLQVYFTVSGLTTADAPAVGWVSFVNREGSPITGDSPQVMLLLLGTEQVTLEITVPANGEAGDYVLEVWMVNQEHKRISEKHTFTVTATAASEVTSSNLFLYGIMALLFAGIAGGGYWYLSRSDDDDDDDDEPGADVELPAVAAATTGPVAAVTTAPLEAAPAAVAAVGPVAAESGQVAAIPAVSPVEAVQPAVVEAVAAAPVAVQPVAAQAVAAAPVPVEAQPVIAQPVVAQPVVAQPVVAEAVAVEPVAAQPVIVKAQPLEEEEMEFE